MEVLNTVTQKDVYQFISDLDLTAPRYAFDATQTRSADASEIMKEGKEQSFLADKSLVSFVSGLSEQNRSDVINSMLLAQLAANKKVQNEENILEWYKAFIQVLSNIGWTIESVEISKFESSSALFQLENVIIDILTSAFGSSYLAIIKTALNSLKSLDEGDHKIVAFEKNTHTLSKGIFQIATAVESNNAVSVQLGSFLLTSKDEIRKILLFTSSKDKTTLEYSSRRATLNLEMYSKVRYTVLEKLGDHVINFVAEVDI